MYPLQMNQLHHQQQQILHPLSPITPSLNLISPSGGHGALVDYPPKSPDDLASQSARKSLLSSNPTTPYHPQELQQQQQQRPYHQKQHRQPPPSIPLHLPTPNQAPLNRPTIPHQSLRLGHANQHPDQNLLSTFSEECKKMFYTGDPLATKNVENIIKNLPAGSKATYTKQMAIVRSQFHRDAASSRRAEVDKLLLDTLPSSIIIKAVGGDSSLSAMRSPRARQERIDRLKKFISAHCVRNMVGAHPFFNSLCAVLHLMSLPARKLGSGKRRVEWDIDLALFCEAGGEPFLADSIQLLKGVLGFEDHLKPLVASSLRSSFATSHTFDPDEDDDGAIDVVIGHVDGDDGLTLEERQELEVDESELTRLQQSEGPFADSSSLLVGEAYGQASGLKGKATLKGRDRSLSDPFLDPVPPAVPPQSSPRITVSPPATHDSTTDQNQPATPTNDDDHHRHPHQHRRSPTQNSLDAPPPSEIRIFRSPSYLTTPELRELIDVFPNFISVRTKSIRFDSTGQLDGTGVNSSEKLNKSPSSSEPKRHRRQDRSSPSGYVGHGVIRISVFEKDQGWKGTFLERIKMFIYRFLKL